VEICEPFDKEYIQSGKVYLAPANYHLLFDNGQRFSLSVHDPLNHSRPSIDIIMDSAAEFFREKTIGVILSGANMDGAHGLLKIHNLGGFTIVQDPSDCQISTMPGSCLELFKPDSVINAAGIINFISNL
jgi:two-component system, chemotaxis family, protein-glutamate methylesterase/glutaminase